jgi:hypothetical protein
MLAYIALQTWRPGALAPAIAFTAAGLVVGTEGLGWIDVAPNAGALRLLAEALVVAVVVAATDAALGQAVGPTSVSPHRSGKE